VPVRHASFPAAADVREPRIRLGDAERLRIERPGQPVKQLAPGARHPAAERTQQLRVAGRTATVFRRAGAARAAPPPRSRPRDASRRPCHTCSRSCRPAGRRRATAPRRRDRRQDRPSSSQASTSISSRFSCPQATGSTITPGPTISASLMSRIQRSSPARTRAARRSDDA